MTAWSRFVFVVLAVGCASQGGLQAGLAEVDITPPVGYPMAGYHLVRPRVATAILDSLHAKALVLRQGEASAAIVVVDLVGMPATLTSRARQEAAARTGIPAANITIAATHTHTGPSAEAHPDNPIDYPDLLVARLVEAITTADAGRRAAELGAGGAQQSPVISFQRRHLFKDGQVRTIGPTIRHLPEYGPENVVRAAGPIDPQVGLLAVSDPGSTTPRGVLTVFALHLNTVGDTRLGEPVISADYAHFLERELRRRYGPAFHSLFGAGTCGDINYVDGTTTEKTRTSEEIGTLLSRTVVAAMPALRSIGEPALAVRSFRFDAPLRPFTPEQIAQARKDAEQYQDLGFLRRAEVSGILKVAAAKQRTLPVEVQVFRLSRDLAIVTLPGEVFVEHGLAIKKASPFPTTLVIELANDSGPAYVPTRKAFGEGAYEVYSAFLAEGAGERMVDEATRLLRALR